ncbi:MAG TPA: YggT family protein [Candidatus Saccharimonadales bacterium]|nr:YggT family protein [Candidatus Saccharimonadales bacterium]
MRPQVLATRLINFFTGIVMVFLGLRFVLKLFGANPTNGFVGWVYDNTSVLLDPFRGIFNNEVVGRHYVFEFNTLFAILIYALFGMLLLMLVDVLTPADNRGKRK